MPRRAGEPPTLVACAHGTRNASGRRALALLRLAVSAARPEVPVLAASIDVQRPSLTDTLARLREQDRPAVVVPLLLSAGYHVFVDVVRAVRGSESPVLAAAALGPDPLLVDLLHRRLGGAGGGHRPGDAVVLAAAGSSDARAVRDVETTAAALADRGGVPVTAAYLSAAHPRIPEAVTAARTAGARRVVVATYLLAPGFFLARLDRCGADVVTPPLAPDPTLADLVLRRYDEALAGTGLIPGSLSAGGFVR
jgi:sirohydrochlorin ferrochelatase